MAEKEDPSFKLVQKNRKAWHEYEITEKVEAGLVLKGSEVKALREGNASILEAYAKLSKGEAWIVNMDIQPYAQAGPFNHEPKRLRKLLLNRTEINRLASKTAERGLTLIPLSLYFKAGYAKVEIGVAKGKKVHDKRAAIKKRDVDRDLRRRAMK